MVSNFNFLQNFTIDVTQRVTLQISCNSPHPKINEQMNKNYKYRNTKTKIEDSNIVIHTMIQYPRYRYTRDEEGIQLYTMQQYTIVLSGVKVFRKLQHLDLCIGLENQPTPIKSLLNGKFHLNTILSSYLVSWIKSVYNTLDQKF